MHPLCPYTRSMPLLIRLSACPRTIVYMKRRDSREAVEMRCLCHLAPLRSLLIRGLKLLVYYALSMPVPPSPAPLSHAHPPLSPHTPCVYVLILVYLSVRYCICPHVTVYVLILLCVLILLYMSSYCYMCPPTTVYVLILSYVSSYYYVCGHTTEAVEIWSQTQQNWVQAKLMHSVKGWGLAGAHIYGPIILYMCPHATIYMSPYYYIYVRILLYIYPHTTIYMSAYYYIYVPILLYICPHTTIYMPAYYYIQVPILLYICPHTTIYMSPYYYIYVSILVYMSAY